MKIMFDVDCLKERIENIKMAALLAYDQDYVGAMDNVLDFIDDVDNMEDE